MNSTIGITEGQISELEICILISCIIGYKKKMLSVGRKVVLLTLEITGISEEYVE
jgi:hypothetical protein